MSWLTPTEQRRLGRACADYLPLGKIYQVGSSLRWKKGDGAPRDIDLRMLLDDDQFEAMAPAQWELIADAIGVALEAASGVGRIDFQIQLVTAANDEHTGPRSAIFLSGRDAKPCDDRTCTDRDHWAPRDPNRCDPGCTRPSLHDGDCTAAADPLDESDHRPRHSSAGHLTWRRADLWCHAECACQGVWRLPDLGNEYGPLTFCDCDATIEAENGATD